MRHTHKRKPVSKRIALQALEQRLLLDGAALATAVDAVSAESVDNDLDNALDHLPIAPQLEPEAGGDSPYEEVVFSDASYSAELVFIDKAVADLRHSTIEDLLSSIDPSIPVYFIDSNSDGIDQIADIVSGYTDIDAIHIFSHGSKGEIELGSSVLNGENMQTEYSNELAAIGDAIAENGDILLYGCDFSSGPEGEAATALLSQLTGADIAASTDLTGAEAKGGDWDLELNVGAVEVQSLEAKNWSGILVDTDGDGVDDADDLDDDNDGILDAEECEALAHTDGVRFVVGHHTTGILTPDGRLLLTGDDTQPTGTSNHNTFTEVNPDNGYAYTGNIIDFAIAGLDSPQYILATTDGLYAWGAEGQAVPATYTTGTAFEQIALPPGVSAADVVAVDASNDSRDLQGVAAILTSAGEVWVSGDDHASSYGDGSTVLDSAWHQVLTAPGVPLTGVTELEMSVQGGFAVTAGGVYAWGQGAFLGDGTGASDTAFATLMTLHADFTSTADIVEIELSIEDNDPNSYAMLHSNGKLYTLGSNHRGELGQNTLTADITSWGIVQNPAGTADMENIFFVDGQSHSQRQFVAGFVFLADDPTIAGSSETYFMGRNSGDAMTEGVVGATGLPEIPTYYLASYTDVTGDGNVDEADFNASAIALSSHLSVYYDESQESFAFSGHNEAGAFGQVPVVEDRFVVSAVPLDLGLDCDTDGDGIPDHLDLDSDNDGISDLEESGQDPSVVDADGDGVVDGGVNADGIPLAANGGAGVDPVDSDGDGLDDYLDLDSDNDGIPDVVEGQPTIGYVPPSGMDGDGDGVDDAWDTTTGHGGDFIGTEDTDSDGTPDYLDTDSDGDGASDSAESGLPLSGTDADGDGIDDGVNASYSDPDGDVNTPIDDLENATDNDLTDADYRSVNDKDGDGVADFEDLDDDNDGILDTEEGLQEASFSPALPDEALNGADVNDIQQGDVFVYRNALTASDGTSYDLTMSFDLISFNADNNLVDIVRFSPGTGALNIRNLDASENDFVAYSYTVTAAGSSTGANPAGTPVNFNSATVVSRDIDGTEVAGFAGFDTIAAGSQLTPGTLTPPAGFTTYENNGAISVSDTDTRHHLTATYSSTSTIQILYGLSVGNAEWDGGRNAFTDLFIAIESDTDKDGLPDHCDLDSDNDGISDLEESGQDPSVVDTDGDGVVDGGVNSDGIPLAANGGAGVDPVDSDDDGLDDYLDLDSDNDGIPDVVEGQPTTGYVPPSGMDGDGDGVDDAWDTTTGHGGDFIGTEDTDSDGTPDYLDTDSDGDGASDSAESGLPLSGTDADGDGIDDGVNASYSDPDGDVNTPIDDLENATDNDLTDADYRSVNDKDGDGVADFEDLDDDNDGILDTEEGLQEASFSPALPDEALNGADVNDIQQGDVFVYRNALTASDGTSYDLTMSFDLISFNADNNLVDIVRFSPGTGALNIRNLDASENDFVAYSYTVTAAGSSTGANPAGTPVNFNSATVVSRDIDGTEVAGFAGFDTIAAGSQLTPGTLTPPAGFTTYENNGAISVSDTDTRHHLTATYSSTSTIQILYGLSVGNAELDGGRNAFTDLFIAIESDTDKDGLPDHCDLDSDNDGISDLEESGQDPSVVDTDGDGVVDGGVNSDGIPLAANGGAGVDPVDSDDDGLDDYLDLDSDDDGIPDVVEGQPTTGYVPPSGMDSDGDGVDDAWDTTTGHGGDFIGTEDTDMDGKPDYLDTDSDGDGASDTAESGLTLSGDDLDGDGIDDSVNASYADPDGDVNTPIDDLENATDNDPSDVDYRSVPILDAVDDPFTTNEDTPVNVNPIPNDDDGAGIDTVTVDSIPDATTEGELTYTDAGGNTVVVAPGDVLTPAEAATLTFTPVADFNGTVPPINYTLTDVNGETSEADILIDVTPTPDAVDDPFTTNEDTPVNVNPIPNDDDGAGIDTVTVDSIPDPATEGELTYTDAGGNTVVVSPGDVLTPAEAATLTFTPVADFNGTVPPINYTLTDVNGETSEADILIDVTPTPDALDDPFTTNEDTPVNVNPIPNDDDGAGIDTVTVDSIPDPATEGELTYTDAGGNTVVVAPGDVLTPAEAATLTFAPVADFNGTVPPINYTLTDVNGETSEADVLIDVTPTPDAVDDPFTTNEDTPVNVNPIPNDDDGAGIDTVTVDSIPDPATEGELTYTDAGGNTVVVVPGDVLTPAEAATLTFTPVADFNGTVPPINYTLTDVNGETSEADILIDVTPTPDAVDDPFTTNEDTPVNVNPIPNDDDGAGIDTVTVDSIPDPATEGELTYTDAGGNTVVVSPGDVLTPAEAATLTFTPVADFNGTVPPINYTLTDVNGETSEADILIDVTPTPDALDDPFTTNEDTPVNVNPIPNDDDGAGIDTVTVDSIPDATTEGELTYTDAGGNTVVVAPGDVLTPAEAATLTFAPVADFNGTVPPINYTLTDVNGETSEADILIDVTPTPDAVDDPFTTNEDSPVNVNPIPNDDDGAGIDTVTVDSIPDATTEGELTYTDAGGNTVVVSPGDVLTPAEAATLTFTPVTDFNGTVPPINYTLTDVNGETSEADILIDVTPTPDALDDPFTTNEDTPVNVNPIPNDDDGAGIDTVTVDSIPDATTEGELTYTDAGGNTVVVAPGDVLTPAEAATLTFAPVADFNGTVPPINYTLTDVNGETSEADVLIDVTPTPDAVDDPFTTNEDTPVNVNPIPNDDDGAGIDTVTVDSIPDPATEGELTYTDAGGNTVVVAPGDVLTPAEAATLTFTPVTDFNGTVPPINYTLTDVNGETSEADILIDVTPTPDAVDDPFTTNEDTPVNVNPIPNDDDGAGIDTVTVDSIPDATTEGELTYTDAGGNTVVVAPGDVLTPAEAATLTFTPVADFNGTVPPINYTLTDVNGETSEADILIDVTPTPDAVDTPFTTNEDTPVNVNPISNDDDGAGIDTVTVDSIPDPATEGELTYTDAGGNTVVVSPGDVLTPAEAATLTFTPVADFNGTVPPINYTLTDVNGETSEADILIDVTPTPDAVDDPFTTNEDTPVNVNPIPNDDDGAGIDTVTVDSIPDPATEGELTYTDAGGNTVVVSPGDVLTPAEAATLTFTPVADFNGTVPPINYTLTDVNGETSEADILIDVTPTPDALDTPFTTNEDTPVNVNPIPNDDDGAGIDTVTVDSIPDPATEGELTYTDAGGNTVVVAPGDVLTPAEAATLTFTPVTDFNGTVPPINYTLTDVNGETSEADILIDVTPTPDAVDDPFTTNEDTPVNVNPIPNDDDGAGIDTVTVDSIPDATTEGELTYTDAGGNTVVVAPGDVLTPAEAATLTFTPVADFNGTVPPINYTLTDVNGETSEADILIDVTPTPDAVDDPFTTNEDTPVNVNPIPNDDDGAGIDTVTVDSIPDPATEGELTYTDAGGNTVVVSPGDVLTPAEAATLTFTPVADFNGTVPPINYTLTDVNGETSEADILIDVTPTPDALDTPFTTNEDTPVNVNPISNDDDGAGIDTVTVDSIPDPATEGELTYTDAGGNTVVVSPGDVLTPAEAATLTFTPVADFNGTVPPINYTLTDVNGETSEADILIDVTPTPDALDTPFTTNEDTPVNVNPISNDDDGAGIDTVTVDSIPDPATEGELTYTDAGGNTVVVSPGDVLTPAEAATLTFTPVADFNGTVPPINYTLTDVNGETSEADILIDVTPTPDALDTPFTMNEDTPVNVNPISNDDDGAGIDTVTVDSIPNATTEGELTYTDAGGNTVVVAQGDVLTPAEAATLTFTPVADFNGTVPPINYTLTDVNGETSEADILIDVTPTPDALDTPFTTNEDTPVNVNPISNDDDGAGIDTVTVDSIPDPATEGELTYTDAGGNTVVVAPGDVLTPAEAATLTFTPVTDFNGTVPPINYTLTDVNGETSEADILIDVTPTPDAVDDPFTTNEDTPVNVNPIPNDDDGAGIDTVTVDSIPDATTEGELTYTDAGGNTVVVAPGDVLTPAEAATLTFTPVADFNGTVPPINYTLTDVNGETSEADILIDVTPTPDAVDDPFTTNEDTPVNVNPIPNDDDGAGIDTVTVDSIPDPATEGELTYTDAGGNTVVVSPGDVLTPAEAATLTFTPVADFNGTVPPINYTLTDVNGETSEADILIDVTPTPDALDTPFTTNEDTPVNVNPISNDDDGAGIDTVTVDSIPDPATEGELTYTDAGGNTVVVSPGDVLTPAEAATLTFTPVADFNGTVPPINYTLTDVNGETSEADILIDVTPTPDALDTPFTTNEDTPVNVNPISNDDDGAGIDTVTVDSIPDPATEGELTYTDAGGNTVVVSPGDVLTPAEAATLTFTPVADFNGTVPPINYTLTDVNGETSEADILIDVTPTPDALDTPFTTNEDTPVNVNPISNDDDGAGIDTVTVDSIPDPATEGELTYTDAGGNTVVVSPGDVLTPAEAATLTFTPVADFNGTVPPINYTLTDVNGETSEADILIDVTPTPDAGDDAYVTNDETPVAVNLLDNDDVGAGVQSVTINNIPDSTTEGSFTYIDDLTGLPVVVAAGDVLSPAEAATVEFAAVADFVGMVPSVSYTVTDVNGEMSDANIDITVTSTPDALPETVMTGFETPVDITPLANDTDADGDPLTITEINGVLLTPGVAQSIAVPNGTVTVATDGTITVTPDAGYSGDIDVPYTIVDPDGNSDSSILTVEVANAPPVVVDPDPTPGTPSIDPLDAENILVSAVDGTPITIDLDDYLNDPNGDTLTIIPDSLPAGATFDSVTNELTFVPTVDNTGDAVIPFTVIDGNGGVTTPSVTIQPVNPVPDAVDETVTTEFETPVVIDPLANDTDPDGDPLTITEIDGVALTPGVAQTIAVPNGTVDVAPDGTITVTPDTGYSGDIDVLYTIVDQDGDTATATHTVAVDNQPPVVEIANPVPDGPSIDPADPLNVIVPAVDGEPLTIDLDSVLTDPEGAALTVDINSIPEGVSFNPATNELTFVPAIDNDGDTVLPVTVIDSAGNVINPTITVQPVNPPPEASPDVIETDALTPVVVNFLANDNDPDSDNLSLLGAPVLLDPASGTLELVGDQWIFTPAADFTGEAIIAYTIQDQDGATATSTHSVVVAGVSFVEPGVGASVPELIHVEQPERPTALLDSEYEREFIRVGVDGELVILSMANDLSSLNGNELTALGEAGNDSSDLEHDLIVHSFEPGVTGSEGFSSGKGYRGTHSVDPTDECGRFFIDTIIREEMLSVIARSTIDPEQSIGVIGFNASMADGSPLPAWVSQLADGEYLIDRTVDIEVIALKLVAHREDGSSLTRVVAIDTLTGEIREQGQPVNFTSSFSEELQSDVGPVTTIDVSLEQ